VLSELASQVQQARSQVDRETGEARAVALQGKALQQELGQLAAQHELLNQAAAVLARQGEERQEATQRQLEGLVSRGLQSVFDENTSFHMVQTIKANQPVIEFVIRTSYGDSVVDTPVMEARGGGMAATVGFMLRLVVMLLTPNARRILFLDETFGHVSAEYEPRLAEFLREVADKAGVQLFLVTHSDAYSDAADKRYRLKLGADGSTQLEEG
jgi:DNA repair exonuclease SbcCD ATPase subunit